MTIEEEPQMVELRGAEAMRMHHLWGTNGLVLELEMALAPAHPWLETLVTFDSFENALDFADKLANGPGIVKREIAFFAAPIPITSRSWRRTCPRAATRCCRSSPNPASRRCCNWQKRTAAP
jgi:hypothetical protein